MNKDMLGRYHTHKSIESKRFRLWYNWRPAVVLLGCKIAISKDYIEIEIQVWFNLTISILFGKVSVKMTGGVR